MTDKFGGCYLGTEIKEMNLVVYKICDSSINFCWFEQLGKEIQWAVTGNENRNSEQVAGPVYIFQWLPPPPTLSVDLTLHTDIAPTPISRLEE
jgi:hypothetical protein